MNESFRQPRGDRRAQRGFTLLEALVVLVIAGLIAVVLIQGFGTVLAVRTSVAGNVLDLQTTVLERSVIADPIKGIVPDYPERPHVFKGERQSLQGLTIRPVNGPFGVPRPFRLFFAYDTGRDETTLRYVEDYGAAFDVARWRGARAGFAYRDVSGAWVDAWPPAFDDNAPQTPWLVRIDSGLDANPVIIAYVASPHERRHRIEDVGFSSTFDDRSQ